MGIGQGVLTQAESLLEQKQYPQVVDLLSPLLEQHPDDARGWEVLSVAYFQQEQWEQAAATARRIVDLAPQSGRAMFNWGIALRKQGNLPGAIRAQRQALLLEPGHRAARLEIQKINNVMEAEATAATSPHRPTPQAHQRSTLPGGSR